jgi:hypothetical protein
MGATVKNSVPCSRCAECQQDCWAKDNCRQGCLHCVEKKQQCSLVWGATAVISQSTDTFDRLLDSQEKATILLERMVMASMAMTLSVM